MRIEVLFATLSSKARKLSALRKANAMRHVGWEVFHYYSSFFEKSATNTIRWHRGDLGESKSHLSRQELAIDLLHRGALGVWKPATPGGDTSCYALLAEGTQGHPAASWLYIGPDYRFLQDTLLPDMVPSTVSAVNSSFGSFYGRDALRDYHREVNYWEACFPRLNQPARRERYRDADDLFREEVRKKGFGIMLREAFVGCRDALTAHLQSIGSEEEKKTVEWDPRRYFTAPLSLEVARRYPSRIPAGVYYVPGNDQCWDLGIAEEALQKILQESGSQKPDPQQLLGVLNKLIDADRRTE